MSNTIHFDRTVTSYGFYTKVLNELLGLYSKYPDIPPIFDFRETRYINPAVVPIMLAFGDYVRRLYKENATILYERGSELHDFFIDSRFLEVSDKLGIFKWEKLLLEGTSLPKNNTRKVSYNLKNYPDVDKIEDSTHRRNYIFDCLRDKTKVEYREVLAQAGQLGEEEKETIINSLAEIGTNSIMYSKSHSFSYVASDRFKIIISMADSGIGFEKSFIENGRKLEILDEFSHIDNKFRNYLVIMSALKYSYDKHKEEEREDLWTLRTKVINNHGVFKIQHENTQVIFSHIRCGSCLRCSGQNGVVECVNCLMNDYSSASYSPIKIYGVRFQGIRVEISFDKLD